MLGPVLFSFFTTPLRDIITRHQVCYHKYADDLQLYVSYNPADSTETEEALDRLPACVADVRAWMLANTLKLNSEKTEYMVLMSKHHLAKYGKPPTLLETFPCILLKPSDI